MNDQADPLDGWPLLKVHHTISTASQDTYGKLFVYLREVMRKFLRRLAAGKTDFDLYNVHVKELPQYLTRDRYDRIEVGIPVKRKYFGDRC